MVIEMLSRFFLWSFVSNICLLILYGVLILTLHDWVYRMHSKWFKIPIERFDAIHYCLLGGYKSAIVILNLVPWIALQIVK